MNTQDKIKIMQNWVDGEIVQVEDYPRWETLDPDIEPNWNWKDNYRVKPKPKVIWILYNNSGDVIDVYDAEHKADRSCRNLGYGQVVEFKEVTNE